MYEEVPGCVVLFKGGNYYELLQRHAEMWHKGLVDVLTEKRTHLPVVGAEILAVSDPHMGGLLVLGDGQSKLLVDGMKHYDPNLNTSFEEHFVLRFLRLAAKERGYALVPVQHKEYLNLKKLRAGLRVRLRAHFGDKKFDKAQAGHVIKQFKKDHLLSKGQASRVWSDMHHVDLVKQGGKGRGSLWSLVPLEPVGENVGA